MTSKSIVTFRSVVLHHPCPPHHHFDGISSHSDSGGGMQALVAAVEVVEVAEAVVAIVAVVEATEVENAVAVVGLGLVGLVETTIM
eukprot:8779782-Ditylum_brightwellii.AAC.1